MAAEEVNRKRRVKKNIEADTAHIHSTFNSTIIVITDAHGNALAQSSAGSLGSKGSRKSTPSTAQATVETVTKATMGHGLKTAEVTVKGPGSGHEVAIHSLQATSLEVTIIHDVTPVSHNGARPSKRRHV